MLVALRVTVIFLLVIIVLMLWQSCKEQKKNVRRSQQATGSNRKHNESLGSFQKLQEVSLSSRKPQEASGRHSIKIIINKQKASPLCPKRRKKEKEKKYMLHMTCVIWHVKRDMWHVTLDMWNMTCDMLCGVIILSKFKLPSPYGILDAKCNRG